MKKVCILYSGWYNAPNGASSFVKSFVDNQSYFSEKIELDVYSKERFVYKDFTNKETIKKRNKIKFLIHRILQYSTILSIVYNYFVEERHMREIVKRFCDSNPNYDVIHCQELSTAYYLYKYYPSIKSKVFLTLHTNGEDFSMVYTNKPALNSWLGKKYLYNRLNFVLTHITKVGFVSRKSMEIFSQNHPLFEREKLFYVYNGIIDKDFVKEPTSNKGRLHFICVGSLTNRKNQMGLIEAITRLTPEEKIRVELSLVGDGIIREKLQDAVLTNNLDCVNFIGNTTEVDSYLKKADVFILVSKDEGLPISIIEAMRIGLPVVGSNVAGIPEQIIDGETGLVIEYDVVSITNAYKYMLSLSSEELMIMGEKSKKLFKERFTVNRMFDNYIKLYQNFN
ncbi:glycosyltransferase involved in cell wall biosynthesis [Bacteroides zoogleoformans]|uniref:Glycosyl transferase family 1 domain-containing protein n=1 Tax=Bacteroides zoogleoformans TaxID=28119 RepID=A0ABM6T6B2_9BACE|nr:glycosyltransferase family 4 protein [Bacteroides zoogleoformans]AVM52295.1 hypothetical protein C4H11_04460 [Bacteroides zoogleoformans]TWJ11303.1 glycosyltransferase involved in cell wall biosynthesis [Bacteroides zoogleoformans]